ncbi:MAG: patatin-like phospholipase family protein [Bacteroidia bacterium]|nr:patatin-like phospholipase family protein [Bacteroidia bacterium]
MNKLKWICLSASSLFFLLVISEARGQQLLTEPQLKEKRNGVAVIMTGAAARIPQEAALLEELYRRGLLKNVVFISGVSSGALNAVMLNGILSGKMTWKEYKEILFSLRNKDIFIQEGKKLPVSTEPARELYTRIVEGRLNYHQIGDLPFMTEISFTNVKDLYLKKRVYRMCSRKINEETDTTLSLVDIMMASSAFPVAFPPVRIRNVSTIPDIEYIDGGVGDDHVPFHSLLEFEKFRGIGVEKVYVISRKSDSIPEVGQELADFGIKDRKIFDRIGISLENILKKGIIKGLQAFEKEAPELRARTFVWIPDFEKDFFLMNFSNSQEQYVLTQEWARAHNPVPLEEFLLPYKRKELIIEDILSWPFFAK